MLGIPKMDSLFRENSEFDESRRRTQAAQDHIDYLKSQSREANVILTMLEKSFGEESGRIIDVEMHEVPEVKLVK